MPKFLNPGKIVILLSGRYAGHKAVIVKAYDDGNKSRSFSHALLAGIERYPLKVTAGMKKKRAHKRSKVKPFVKLANYNHFMPTRYTIDLDLRKVRFNRVYGEKRNRRAVKRTIKKAFEERYRAGRNRWFFSKLRF